MVRITVYGTSLTGDRRRENTEFVLKSYLVDEGERIRYSYILETGKEIQSFYWSN